MRRSRTLFAVLLSFSLLAAACGSDDDSTTPTTTAPAKQSALTTTTAAPAPAPTAAPSGLDELNVAYFLEWPTANQVAQLEQTYDSVLGLTVNWIAFPSGNDMALAMESGDIDISYSQGLTPFANYVTSGADHVIVGVAVSYADADNCVAHPDYAVSQDNAASSLAGQVIYTPIGNVTHFKLLKMLEHLGVSLDDVSLIPSEGGPAAVAAFENGDVAMACAFGGAINMMLASGGNLVMTGSEQEALGIRVFDIISAPRSFAEEHGDVVTAFLQVTEDANAAYAADRASFEATIADAAGMDVAGSNSLLDAFTFLDRDSQLSEAWLGGTVQAAMKEQMDFFVAQGEIDTALDSYDGVVDTSYLAAVVGGGFGAANPKAPSDGDVTGAPAGPDSSDPIKLPIHNWSSQIAGVYAVGAILESTGNTVEYISADSSAVYTAMCEGDMDLVHEVWQGAFGTSFEPRVEEGCVIDAATHDAKTREDWWYPAYVADACPGLPDWEALNDCAALFATPDSGGKGRFLGGPVDWLKGDQERVDGLGMDFIVENAGTAGALWAALDAASANNEPIVLFNWTPNFVEAMYEGAFIEFPTYEDACKTDASWGINPETTHDCGNPKDGYLKLGVNVEFPNKWPNAYAAVQQMNLTNLDVAQLAMYVDIDGMEPEDAAAKWLADNCARWTGWSGADASVCPAAPEGPVALPDLGGRVVTIAVDNAYLPFAYIPADTGVAMGWDYDAMDEVCARINCVPSFQEFAWDGTIIATGEGQFDMAGGGITITEARDEVVDFSISFISTEQKILVGKDDAEIGSRADLEASDCTVGSQTGTTNYDLSVDVVGEARIAAFESFAFAVQALITGDVCAVIMDDVAGQGYQGENADSVDMLAESLQSDPLGWAFTEGSDLVAPFNAALQSMKDDGSLAALNGKYFGTAFIITYDDIGDGAYAEEAAPAVEPLGGDLAMCRANWASGYVQAEIVRQVLQSAGYGVSDPSLLELAPSTAYTTMARGDCDFWANSWYPNHYSWYENELPDGSLVSDHVEAVDGLFQDSGVQGWLITKSWADAEGIVSMDQINRTPALYEALDTDGDGKGEILGCPEDWTCDDTQEQIIAFAGWDNLVQTKAGYDALFAEFVNRVRAGDPGVMYTWTPSSYVVEMVPGVDVYWLSIEEDSVLDDSNPLGMSGGESQSQGDGFRDAPADTCTQPCQLGWEAADIQVSARSDVLTGDPYLHNLLVQIRPSILDISILQVEQTNGDGSEAHVQQLAAGWMELNADIVAGWREAASAG